MIYTKIYIHEYITLPVSILRARYTNYLTVTYKVSIETVKSIIGIGYKFWHRTRIEIENILRNTNQLREQFSNTIQIRKHFSKYKSVGRPYLGENNWNKRFQRIYIDYYSKTKYVQTLIS